MVIDKNKCWLYIQITLFLQVKLGTGFKIKMHNVLHINLK